MLRRIAIHGVIAGLIVGIPLFAMTVVTAGQQMLEGGMLLGYAIMLLALSMVFVGVKRHRDRELGGVIGFLPAFGLGLAISAVAGLFYVLAWESALAVSGIDFMGDYSRFVMADAKAKGASAKELAKLAADMAALARDYANPLYRMSFSFFLEFMPVGLLVSLVSAGLLRNSRFLPARTA